MIESCMKVAICDGEPKDLQDVAAMARQVAGENDIACEFTLYERGAALLKAIQNGARYHTLILDVTMAELGGMELAAALRKQGDRTSIVFISSNWNMALRGYEVFTVRYLAKPIDREKIGEALMVCCHDREG